MNDAVRAAGTLSAARLLIAGLAGVSVLFHVWLIFSGLYPNLIVRPVHLILVLPWIFVIGGGGHGLVRRSIDLALCAGGVGICAWIVWNESALSDQYGFLEGNGQRVMAVALILLVLEMARRAVKLALPVLAAVALAYGVWGDLVPGRLGHAGIPFDSLFGTLVIAEGGLWGPLTGVSVSVVAVFVILGAVVGAGDGGTAFMSLAIRLAGHLRGGAARVSVLASALFGSISGSASANVASTGAFTIPAMTRLGYPKALAGAVEAVASSGGQIMPPLMGAGAFVMVELLGTTYGTIMAAAILPALLFFLATWLGIGWFAKREGLEGMAREDIPEWGWVLRLAPFFLIPFGALLAVLFGTGKTPQFAAAVAIFAATGLLLAGPNGFVGIRQSVLRFESAIVEAARQIALIASIIICAGLIIGVLNMTGLGVKITSMIVSLSGNQLWPALLLTALACVILGMEVPTTAAYVICVSVAGPALQELGLPALHTHLFVFWYALLSTITPPVCGTVFIAAGMAGAPWLRVSGYAMRLGLGLYFVPLAMIANPDLITPAEAPFGAAVAFVRIAAGLALLGWATVNYRERSLLSVVAAVAGTALLLVQIG